eukprot:366190-Chlamydomonas_euryale.AAC.7
MQSSSAFLHEIDAAGSAARWRGARRAVGEEEELRSWDGREGGEGRRAFEGFVLRRAWQRCSWGRKVWGRLRCAPGCAGASADTPWEMRD